MTTPPDLAELLRYIGREEPLSGTVRAFPGLSREDVGRLLEAAASQLAAQAPKLPAEPPRPARTPPPLPPEPRAPAEVPSRLKLFSDGAARGNPGPAGAGAVLLDPEGRVVARLGRFLGVQTNNYAEYMGLLLGLKHARSLGAVKELEVLADSELLIRQLQGRYQVKSPTLRPLYEEATALLEHFPRVKLTHVPREKNKAADEMSNRAIDERM
ncbi:ribonuclease HI family protein [Archangium gephyra]|uniref:ribonuclease HI family protein n=1 Tax=Archangium gephyra TaxID=48 RepID=UPI0035D47ACC